MMEAKLIVVGGDAKTTEIDLKLPTIIGRGRGATLTLPHPLVSRQHCEIYEVEGKLYVRDLGSLNGTFVGNEPITEAELPPGELLTIGAVTFRAIYGDLIEIERQENEHSSQPERRRRNEPTKTTRDGAVETMSQPQGGTRKDERPPRAAPPAARPAKPSPPAPRPPVPEETVWAPDRQPPEGKPNPGASASPVWPGAVAMGDRQGGGDESDVDEVAELVEFRSYLNDESGSLEMAELEAELAESGVLDASEDAARAVNEPSADGSTADTEKSAPGTKLGLPKLAGGEELLDEVDVLDEALRTFEDTPRTPAPSANTLPPRSSPQEAPPSNTGEEDELERFLKNLK